MHEKIVICPRYYYIGQKMSKLKIILPAQNPDLNNYGGCGNCNTVLINSEDKWIVVDPGWWPVGVRGYLHYVLKKEGLKPSDIDIVVNTHLHFDHSDNNLFFRGKNLYLHEKDCNKKNMVQDLYKYNGEYNPDNYTIPVDSTEHYEFLVGSLNLKKVKGDFILTNDIKLIETPGHTPGSISVIVETNQGIIAIIGDLAIRRQDYIERRLPHYVRDKEAILNSYKKIMRLSPSVVIPGHDLPIWDFCKFKIPIKNYELTDWFPEGN
jgi:glyoxylase-like metal-dependent hydrolase (beta-lactamase superfamily II)